MASSSLRKSLEDVGLGNRPEGPASDKVGSCISCLWVGLDDHRICSTQSHRDATSSSDALLVSPGSSSADLRSLCLSCLIWGVSERAQIVTACFSPSGLGHAFEPKLPMTPVLQWTILVEGLLSLVGAEHWKLQEHEE